MAVKSILGFWLLYIGLITLRSIVLQYPDFWAMLARRSCAVAAGISVTFLVYLAMQLVRHSTLRKKAILAGILCLPASLAFTTVNYLIFYIIAPMEVGEYVHRHLPGSTLRVMRATGHCPHMSHPDETIQIVRDWLARAPAP